MELRLYEKYRPKSLTEIVGQPVVGQLQEIAERPFPLCVLIEGPTGTGKTTAAYALAQDMGCYDTTVWPGCHTVCGADFTAEMARHWFGPETPLRFVSAGQGLPRHGDRGTGIPQSHGASAVQGLLRAAAGLNEGRAGRHQQRRQQAGEAVAASLPQARRSRPESLSPWPATSGWPRYGPSKRTHADMPHGWEQFGMDGEEFSFRQALDTLDCYLNVLKMREAG